MKDEAFLSQQFRKKCSPEVDQHCRAKKTKYAKYIYYKTGNLLCSLERLLFNVWRI
jgi:hypothetical protein